jgi:hypothetical protein
MEEHERIKEKVKIQKGEIKILMDDNLKKENNL